MFRILRASVFCAALLPLPATAQVLDLLVCPQLDVPVGPLDDAGASRFGLGGGLSIEADYRLPFLPLLQAMGQAAYDFVPLNSSDRSGFSLVSLGLGVRAELKPIPVLGLDLSAGGGYGMILFGGAVYPAPFVLGRAGLSFALAPLISVGVSGTYRHFFGSYYGLSVNVGTSIHFGVEAGSKLRLRDIELSPVFPVFYSYYSNHELGKLVLRNDENESISEVQVSFYVKQYMDKPKPCVVLKELRKGEEREVLLYGLFTDAILKVTEGTQVSAEIAVEYRLFGKTVRTEKTETLSVYNRNAMTWDDDRHAASFVTARDPTVMQYAKTIGGMAREKGAGLVNVNFCEAMGLFESLALFGLNYVVDPKSSYAEYSENESAVDYLQFPAQTLRYKAGDCDDLSILCCALLESIGIDTAFITVPGHIFMAFCLDMTAEEARSLFSQPQDLVVVDDRVWVPVEITMVQQGFARAWQEGAREWRQAADGRTARFYPVGQAWELFPPTAMAEEGAALALPDQREVATRFGDAMKSFALREVSDRAAKLQQEIARANNPKSHNALGTLYARFGLYDEAQAAFRKAADAGNGAALVNLGNIAYLRREFKQALAWYDRANGGNQQNAAALLGIAKSQYELGNLGLVAEAFAKLEALSPSTAQKYSYLAGRSADSARASSVNLKEGVLWAEAD